MEFEELTEECASLSFIQKFLNKYESSIPITICNLSDAINRHCLVSRPKKGLVLYLHNDNDQFANVFCTAINMREQIWNNFFILGWDVETTQYHTVLIRALQNYSGLSNLYSMIEGRMCAALFIVPHGDSVMLYLCARNINSHEEFFSYLSQASDFIQAINNSVSTINRRHETMSVSEVPAEQVALSSFMQMYRYSYPDSNVIIRDCSLVDAIAEIQSQSKILILYLHNKNDSFSTRFCSLLNRAEYTDLINRRFIVLGWDIENSTSHSMLRQAIDNFIELSCLDALIHAKTCAAVLVAPIQSAVTIISCMRSNTSDEMFGQYLTSAELFVLQESQWESELLDGSTQNGSENDVGSEKFQQIMCDLLIDRDYDRFEYNQHDLLKKKIMYAFCGPPQNESDSGDKKTKKLVEAIYKIILKENNTISKWKDQVTISFLYNCVEPLPETKLSRKKKYPDYNPVTDLTPYPIFVLRRCKHSDAPCRIIIDHDKRTYTSWSQYIQNNKLPKCRMILPRNGRYQTDCDGKVLLETHASPSCGIGSHILHGTDITSSAVGIVSGSVIAVSLIPAVTLAPVVITAAAVTGVGVGVYAIGRSISTLVDKGKHKESLSFADSQARGAYLNIVAGSLGFVGAGANLAITQLAVRGVNIGRIAGAAVNTLNVINIGASGVSVLNSSYDVIDQWLTDDQTPSVLTILQLSSSLLFFGNAVYNYRPIGTMIDESQASTLKAYQESLRSNRHRKTFTRLINETVKQNNGNTQRGHAEVISAIRSIPNKDDVFAALTRNNRVMSQNGVRYSARNGLIYLNDAISINMNDFMTMSKQTVKGFLAGVPSMSEPTSVQLAEVSASISQGLKGVGTSMLQLTTNLAPHLFRMLANSDIDVKTTIINSFTQLLNELLRKHTNFLDILKDIFPGQIRSYCRIFDVVVKFYEDSVEKMEKQYQQWNDTSDPQYFDKIFVFLSHDKTKRTIEIFKHISKLQYLSGGALTETALAALLEYFYNWFTNACYTYQEDVRAREERNRHSVAREKVHCDLCIGYYYKGA